LNGVKGTYTVNVFPKPWGGPGYGENAKNRLGRSAALGDVDGDGRNELLIAAPDAGGAKGAETDTGRLYILSGSGLPKELSLPDDARVYYGMGAGDELGSEVFGRTPLAVADLNRDGASEIVVAAPLGDGPQDRRRDCGKAYILFMKR